MRLALHRLCAFLLVLTVALPWVWAGDDETSAKDPKPAGESPKPAPRAEPTPPMPPAPPAGGLTRKDIEELVRRGGRLPDDFVPHGWRLDDGGGPKKPTGAFHREPPFPLGTASHRDAMEAAFTKATGTLILKYLAEKDDPARAAVYEDVLKALGTTLSTGAGSTIGGHVPGLMTKLMAGLQDPAKAPVYRDIMRIFGEALEAAGPRPPGFVFGKNGPPPTAPVEPRAVPAPPLPPGLAPRAHDLAGATVVVGYKFDGVDSFKEKLLTTRGLGMVERVPVASNAYAAGLRAGDTILSLDGKPVSGQTVQAANKAFVPGGKLRIELRRKEGKVEILDLEFEADDAPTDPKK